MHLSTRVASSDDFNEMVRLCHPEPGCDLSRLKSEWSNLWNFGQPMGVVVEDSELPASHRSLALMIATYVSDEFLQSCIESHLPKAVSRLLSPDSGNLSEILDVDSIASQNAREGNVMFVVYLAWVQDGYGPIKVETLRSVLVNAYADRYAGNNIRWIVGETGGAVVRDIALRTGCKVLNAYPQWKPNPGMEEIDLQPSLVGVNRDAGMAIENYWFHRMFTYLPPRFCFSDVQRQVLLLARYGLTDAEIAADLGVTTAAVKKRWTGIYAKVDSALPGLLPESGQGGRGVEKRRALLAYIRDRPEELHPFKQMHD